MTTNPRQPRSAGIFLAIAPIVGALIGARMGQSSIGLLIGLAVGAGVAVLFWLKDRSDKDQPPK